MLRWPPCPASPRASFRPSPPSTPRRGTPAPIRRVARLKRPRANGSTRSSPTPSCMRSRPRARSAAARAGRRRISRLKTRRGRMVAAAPCYLKSHSQGEYVFDHAWADAYERAGRRLLSEAPGGRAVHAGDRTPPPRRRRCARGRARGADRGACGQLRKQTKTSSIHVTFSDRPRTPSGYPKPAF